jgi:transposase-like protein
LNKTKIGGVLEDGSSIIVEIDEILFFKRKYNRGIVRNRMWYVRWIQRGSNDCFIVPVSNRNAETMRTLILENIYPGSTIITDEWRAYGAALHNLEGYNHATINHTYNFVDPEDSMIHTQSIESLWSHSKRALRKKNGINKNKEFEHLVKFMWEKKVEKFFRFNEVVIMFMAFDYNVEIY